MKRKTGTREWSQSSLNLQIGCTHGCRYCYARAMALRFGRIAKPEDWARPRIDSFVQQKVFRLRRGVTMFPTQHDITALNVSSCVRTVRHLCEAGNQVLLVSKPDVPVWHRMLEGLDSFRAQITLRFTIGCLDDDLRRFWEPMAPPIEDRIKVLQAAYAGGWRTSVSCEPLLEPQRAGALIERVRPFVNDTIWIGAANKLAERTAWCRGLPGLAEKIRELEAGQASSKMRAIYNQLNQLGCIRWKDSYQQALGLKGPEGGLKVKEL